MPAQVSHSPDAAPRGARCDSYPGAELSVPDTRAAQVRLARFRALGEERRILVEIAVRRLQQSDSAFTAYRGIVAATLQAHLAAWRRNTDADAAAAAQALQRLEHHVPQLAAQADSLIKSLISVRDDLEALEKHAANLLDAAGAIDAAAEKSCLPAGQPTGRLLLNARNYAERARRALTGVREVSDAASVGFVAVPSLAAPVRQEALRLRQLQDTRAQPASADVAGREFRELLGATSGRLARLEASLAAAPGRLSIEFPQPPDIGRSAN